MTEKCLINITTQGAPIINSATIMRKSEKLIHFTLDLRSKYIEVSFSGNGTIGLDANEYSLKLCKDKQRNDLTVVEFVGYEDWSVIGTSTGRYSVDVVLSKEMTQEEYETAYENTQFLPTLEYEGETNGK